MFLSVVFVWRIVARKVASTRDKKMSATKRRREKKTSVVERAPEAAVVFTHSGVIRCILAALLDLPAERAFRIAVDFGSVSLAVFDAGRPMLHYVNR